MVGSVIRLDAKYVDIILAVLTLVDEIVSQFGMLLCTAIVFVFSALEAASKGPGAQGTINALMYVLMAC